MKERARALELELEQLRAFEQSTNLRQKSSNEYELKHLREMYEKKMHKQAEEIAKKAGVIRDMEGQIQQMIEERRDSQV
jgi:hypothetical protein